MVSPEQSASYAALEQAWHGRLVSDTRLNLRLSLALAVVLLATSPLAAAVLAPNDGLVVIAIAVEVALIGLAMALGSWLALRQHRRIGTRRLATSAAGAEYVAKYEAIRATYLRVARALVIAAIAGMLYPLLFATLEIWFRVVFAR